VSGGETMKKAICVGLLMCAAAMPVGAGEPERLTIRVSPAVSFAPANLVVRAMISADSGNRMMEVVAESEDFYRSSQIDLDGERAPRTTMFEFRSLPPGTYEVKGTLRGSGGEERAAVRLQVNVISSAASR
jgi:hypothetical protein